METTTILTILDWTLIALLLLFSLSVGFFVKDQASEGGVEGFFAAGRNMRWYFLGTSIVATTFASDTPLAITGWIAKYGIAGNWFWWGSVISTVAMTVFFARKWRTSGVLTDTEITELRYGGRPATVLRTFKAFLNSTFVNFIILGWVFAGMAKISEPFMDWEALLGPTFYYGMEALYPSFLIFHTFDNTITIWLLVSVTLGYSAMGGLRAVIFTDLVQFTLAMVMSILLSWFAVQHIGGLEATWSQLAELYPKGGTAASTTGEIFLSYEQISAFVPSFEQGGISSLGIPFSAFMLTLGFLWWSNGNVDGSGYIAQRLYTAKDGGEAEKGAIWYGVANFLLRSWPWAIAGVAALIIYPRGDINSMAEDFTQCLNDKTMCSVEMTNCMEDRYQCPIKGFALLYRVDVDSNSIEGKQVATKAETVEVYREDRERGYPALLRDVLPAGLVGLALASLMAAFMSTISTHINWGASYIANDFYYRFVNPNASDKKLTLVSRISTVIITLSGVYVATFIDNIGSMWELWGGLMAGLGLPHLLRWLWWRANAWTEISGMAIGFSLAFFNYIVGQTSGFAESQMSIFPIEMASHPIHVICWISLVAGSFSLAITFLTPQVSDEQLKKFVAKVRPMGFWKGHNVGFDSERSFGQSIFYFFLGTFAIYAGMFGIGYLLRLEYLIGISLLGIFSVMIYIMVKGMAKIDNQQSLE
ncbi:MAG: Na+:solute symporter [Gammaproteobacteria bacterium]|nr:Na+:solute symporter [Gammaproteobacteria bacterium]